MEQHLALGVAGQTAQQFYAGAAQPGIEQRGSRGESLLELQRPCIAHRLKRRERQAVGRHAPESLQQIGDHAVLLRLGHRQRQGRAGSAALQQQGTRRVEDIGVVDEHRAATIPRPQALGFTVRLRMPPADLQHELPSGGVTHRRHPRALPPGLVRLAEIK